MLRQTFQDGESRYCTILSSIAGSGEGTVTYHTALLAARQAGPEDSKEHSMSGRVDALPVPPWSRLATRFRDKLVTFFLPKHYPDSVHPEYLRYTGWQFLHSVSGTVTGTLSMQALLQALGLSPALSIGMSATTNWIIKDGIGLLGGVLFAGSMGNRLDASPKRYRFLSNLLILAANTAELLSPLLPHLFLPLASTSNIAKNVGWLAASATKAAMHKGLARRDNLGDVTVKAGAQTTAAGLVGTALGIGVSWLVGSDFPSLLAIFAPLSLVHGWSAYRLNTSITTRTLSVARAEALVAAHLHDGTLLTPEQVSAQETFLLPDRRYFGSRLELEPRVERVLLGQGEKGEGTRGVEAVQAQLARQPYALHMLPPARMPLAIPNSPGPPVLALWFREDAGVEEVLRGFYHACGVRRELDRQRRRATAEGERVPSDLAAADRLWQPMAEGAFRDFLAQCQALGWDLSYTHLADGNRRLGVGNGGDRRG